MKAIVCTQYCPPELLEFRKVEKHVPKDTEVLVKVHASSVNYNNLINVTGKPWLARFSFGLSKPKVRIPGGDIAGLVESVGKSVTQFRPGDAVFGDSDTCGFGAFAEYVAVPESVLAQKPANISFEEAAAAVQAAQVALQALRDTGRIQKRQKVMVYGASGGIGSFAVQIAKAFEADVTAVCSTRNVELARSLGADRVIDYTKEDFLKNGQRFDLILATAGYRSIFEFKRVLSPTGSYVATGGSIAGPKAMAQIFQAMLLGPLLSLTGRKKLVAMELSPSQNDLLVMKELLASGQVKPVLDRGYALYDAAEALSYYSEGHTRGKVVISMVPSTKNLTNTEESI